MDHAKLSPSAAHRWLACTGSLTWPSGDDTGSEYAAEGTRAHELAAAFLLKQPMPHQQEPEDWEQLQVYTNYVEAIAGTRYIEQRVVLEAEPGGQVDPITYGTSDCLVFDDMSRTLWVVDLKWGRGVKVDAENNEQLMIYALAAIDSFALIHSVDNVKLVIVQPRLGHISEWGVSVAQLEEFRGVVLHTAEQVAMGTFTFNPGEKQCRWCPGKHACEALAKQVHAEVSAEFDNLDAMEENLKTWEPNPNILGEYLDGIPLIRMWCDAVENHAMDALRAGKQVSGYKLVAGRMGNRQWGDADEVEKTLKSMRLKVEEMYDLKLISPTTAGKLAKSDVIGPKQWKRLQELITQKPGAPTIAPSSDPRPAILGVESFDDETGADLV
jgi:hypothetical protein